MHVLKTDPINRCFGDSKLHLWSRKWSRRIDSKRNKPESLLEKLNKSEIGFAFILLVHNQQEHLEKPTRPLNVLMNKLQVFLNDVGRSM